METQTPHYRDYFLAKSYLDDLKVGFENAYIEQKYEVCENCRNVAESLHEDNARYYNDKILQILQDKSLTKTEQHFLIIHEIFNNEQTLLDLYWYYDINKNNKLIPYREELIEYYKREYKKIKNIRDIRMLVELYRRKGDFKTALKWAKKVPKRKPRYTDTPKKQLLATEIDKIQIEIQLCKNCDNTRKTC
jgi:hypothetical protein